MRTSAVVGRFRAAKGYRISTRAIDCAFAGIQLKSILACLLPRLIWWSQLRLLRGTHAHFFS